MSKVQKDRYLDDELIYWLALEDKNNLLPTEEAVRIFNCYGSLRALWQLSDFYHQKLGMNDYKIRNLRAHINRTKLSDLEKRLKTVKGNNYRIIRYVDEKYPSLLKTLRNPPLFVFHRGSLLNFDDCIAIAGTREASSYGLSMARKIGKTLASKGYTIVSGLARGIDEWAHIGALEAPRGRTIAVLAWMNPVYPTEHWQLANDVSERGAIISQRLTNPQDRSAPSKFVERNYVTSGISQCLIAIESGKEGGTVHQVRIALDQKRKVFALKPRENNKRTKEGFKLFMDMGATPIKSTKDLLNCIREELPGKEAKLEFFSRRSIDKF